MPQKSSIPPENFLLILKAASEQIELKNLERYGDFIKEKIREKSGDEQFHRTVRQTYLALGNLLAACAEVKIDACPMEGFDADEYNEILGLTDRGLNATALAAIGYRADDDPAGKVNKTRKPVDFLFEEV